MYICHMYIWQAVDVLVLLIYMFFIYFIFNFIIICVWQVVDVLRSEP